MPFYFLHTDDHKMDLTVNSKYIMYSEKAVAESTKFSFEEEPGITYCAHKTPPVNWTIEDDIIEVLGHENHVRTKYKRVHTHGNLEMWKNVNLK